MVDTDYRSLITPDRMDNLRRAQRRIIGVPGEIAELGVYRGGSARVLAVMWPERMVHLFDTFEGLPFGEVATLDPKGLLKKGDFACPLEEVEEYLADCLNVRFYPGFFPGTAHGDKGCEGPFAFVHIDCDLNHGAACGIQFFWRRMSPGGIIYFDDYGCEFTGVTEAVNAAFTPEQIELQYDVHGFQIGALVVKQ